MHNTESSSLLEKGRQYCFLQHQIKIPEKWGGISSYYTLTRLKIYGSIR